MIFIGLACSAMGCIGLAQTYGFARRGVARLPLTLWRVQGPFEVDMRGDPIKFWATVLGMVFFYGVIALVGVTAIVQGAGK